MATPAMTREEFTRLTKCCLPALRRFLAALCCGNTAMADDIAQETLIKAYLSIDRLKDTTFFAAWLRRIAINTFLNMRRSQPTMVSYDKLCGIASKEIADTAFRYQALYKALDSLTPKERTSILLYYMEGYSIKEIAADVKVSESAVKQHLSRGRNRLRLLLS